MDEVYEQTVHRIANPNYLKIEGCQIKQQKYTFILIN